MRVSKSVVCLLSNSLHDSFQLFLKMAHTEEYSIQEKKLTILIQTFYLIALQQPNTIIIITLALFYKGSSEKQLQLFQTCLSPGAFSIVPMIGMLLRKLIATGKKPLKYVKSSFFLYFVGR